MGCGASSTSKEEGNVYKTDIVNHQFNAPGNLDRPHMKSSPGRFEKFMAAAAEFFDDISLSALNMKREKCTKRVLMVIDVQNGYDADFIASLSADEPGSLAYITRQHDVLKTYELKSRQEIKTHSPGEVKIVYDKKWNRGVEHSKMRAVSERVVKEINSGVYDLIVFTQDILDETECGVFAVDKTPWSDPTKPIALIPYTEYLNLGTKEPGSELHHVLVDAFPGLSNRTKTRTVDSIGGAQLLFLRKQVDDAFDNETETSERTNGEAWLDNIDVSEDTGAPVKDAKTLLHQLTERGFLPEDTLLSFCGIVTNRCVASTMLHGFSHGYNVQLLEGGCRAANDAEHQKGLDVMTPVADTIE